MAELLKDRDADRSYLNLARKKISEIEASGGQQGDVVSLVNDNLKRADELDSKGERLEAPKHLERSHHSVRQQRRTSDSRSNTRGPACRERKWSGPCSESPNRGPKTDGPAKEKS